MSAAESLVVYGMGAAESQASCLTSLQASAVAVVSIAFLVAVDRP